MVRDKVFLDLDEVKQTISLNDIGKTFTADFGDKNIDIEHDGENFILHHQKSGKKSKIKEYSITPNALDSLIDTLDLPAGLTSKLAGYPDMIAWNIDQIMDRRNGAVKVLTKKDSVVGFVDPGLTIIPNEQIIEALEKDLKELNVSNYNMLGNGQTFLKVTSPNETMKIEKGDNYQGGVHIRNNPMVGGSTKIEAYMDRLICLNGVIAPQAVWSAPKVMDGPIPAWLSSSIKQGLSKGRELFESIRKLKDHKIEGELATYLQGLYHDLKIPETVQESITNRVLQEGAKNLYDVFNHITYVASNYAKMRDNPKMSAALMRASGHLSQHLTEVCGTCNRAQVSVR